VSEYDDKLSAMLIRDEDEVLYAYEDSLGYLTIGVGRLIDKRRGGGISQAESRFLLANDITEKTAQLYDAFPWTPQLDPARRATLISMTFQLGIDGLKKFRQSMEAMRVGDWNLAATRFLQSKVAREQTPARWQRHAKRIRTGEW
jgi:lysozyme